MLSVHPIPMDRSQWSHASKRSAGYYDSWEYAGNYDSKTTYYENLAFVCVKCGSPSIFSAEEQKYAYEVKKKFIRWFPTCCTACRQNLDALLAIDRQSQKLWNTDKESLKNDIVFLKSWLGTIKKIETYRKSANTTMKTCLTWLLNTL